MCERERVGEVREGSERERECVCVCVCARARDGIGWAGEACRSLWITISDRQVTDCGHQPPLKQEGR